MIKAKYCTLEHAFFWGSGKIMHCLAHTFFGWAPVVSLVLGVFGMFTGL